MPSRKAKKPGHLPDGRHVATVANDELWGLCRRGLADAAMVQKELSFRGDAKPKAYKETYVPFSGGASKDHKIVRTEPTKKAGKPDRPTNVKDAKKDKKKNAEG